MEVLPVNYGTVSPKSTSASLVDKNAFLNLLVSQLKYQDPLDPLKADQFMSQLAQMTQVEQLQNISASLDDIKGATATGSASNWISTIGKKMQVESSTLSKGDEVYFTPTGDFDEVVLTLKNLKDGTSQEVRIKKGEPLVYRHEGDDNVAFAAAAFKDGKPMTCTASAYRVVTGIDIENGTPLLVAGSGDSYSIAKIKQIK